MVKPTPISGFPEWLPEQKLIEQYFLDTIRRKYELYGFTPIEPRAIEPLEVLLRKGDDKELYLLTRLHQEASEPEFGLHFDMTVPFARYVAQFRGQLHFPFKRYQIQKAWRGERPQEGRYREFYQADIDVIDEGELPLSYDAEFPLIIHDIMSSLPVPPVRIRINNRKILSGFYLALGVDEPAAVLRIVDKLDKIGAEAVAGLLQRDIGLSARDAALCLKLGQIRTPDASFAGQVRALGLTHPLLEVGLDELEFVMQAIAELPAGVVVADLSIARGLDYYTGTVYECQFVGHEQLGSICGGGRYDDLASDEKVKLPGIGISIGVTRMLGYLFGRNLLRASRRTPVTVMIALPSLEDRLTAMQIARALRARGIATDISPTAQKFGKQIRAAERRGIPYVWFFNPKDGSHEVKDIRSGQQLAADPERWTPPEADQIVQVALVSEPESALP